MKAKQKIICLLLCVTAAAGLAACSKDTAAVGNDYVKFGFSDGVIGGDEETEEGETTTAPETAPWSQVTTTQKATYPNVNENASHPMQTTAAPYEGETKAGVKPQTTAAVKGSFTVPQAKADLFVKAYKDLVGGSLKTPNQTDSAHNIYFSSAYKVYFYFTKADINTYGVNAYPVGMRGAIGDLIDGASYLDYTQFVAQFGTAAVSSMTYDVGSFRITFTGRDLNDTKNMQVTGFTMLRTDL